MAKTLKKKRIVTKLMAWCADDYHAGISGGVIPCPGTPRGERGIDCDCHCHTDPEASKEYVEAFRKMITPKPVRKLKKRLKK